jgi:hypothetical protein
MATLARVVGEKTCEPHCGRRGLIEGFDDIRWPRLVLLCALVNTDNIARRVCLQVHIEESICVFPNRGDQSVRDVGVLVLNALATAGACP